MHDSLNCVKRWISKSYSQCCKGFKHAEDAGKPKNVQELEDIPEEQDNSSITKYIKNIIQEKT